MLNLKNIKNISSFLAFLAWLFLLFLSLLDQYQFSLQIDRAPTSAFMKGLLLNIFIIGTYTVSWIKSKEHENVDLHELIWKVFLTAMVCTLFSGLITFLAAISSFPAALKHVIETITFYIELGLLTVLLITAWVIWKRMILYEKSKFAVFSWLGFEYTLFATTGIHFFTAGEVSKLFNYSIGFFFLWIIVISVNLKWVPHLLFNQKLISIFQLTVILFCLAYFIATITGYFDNELLVLEDMSKNIFFSVLFLFVVVYAVASLLVIIFNLPTSSVFEKKIKELSIFQELSHAVYKGENRQQIYQILLDSAFNTVSADAAWIMTDDGEIFLAHGITREKAMETKEHIYHAGFDEQTVRKIGPRTLFSKSTAYEYNSILAVPLINGNQYFGMLALMKKIQGAFDNTMVSMVNTFVAQVSVALQNLELVSQAVENERYKGELEIAKRVQSRLLPKVMLENGSIRLVARAESADEVGGDYYDFFRVSEHESVVVIADVAGKGISAAFNMAQLKGIFHALVRLNLKPSNFLVSANAALSSCLERAAFITASYFLINTQQQTVCYARAGHCPALYYSAESQTVQYLESEGLGLGIIRNERYKEYVKVSEFRYHPGDLMMLYTDGITEAFSHEHTEQFGYERLQTFFEQHHQRALEEIPGLLIQEIYHFVRTESIDDDFTVLLVKF